MNASAQWYQNTTIPFPITYTDEHWQDLPYFFNERNEGRSRFHQRYDTPSMYQDMMQKTYRMATEVDVVCGRILDVLERQGVLNHTLVIFTTDNGNMHGQKGLAEKWYPYEESLRVPLILYDPRMPRDTVGTRNDAFTLNIDLAPTILAAAGIRPPSVMQGRDIAELYLPPTSSSFLPWRQEFLYEFFWNQKHVCNCVCDGGVLIYVLAVCIRVLTQLRVATVSLQRIPNSIALVRKGLKYIYWPDFRYHQVFDLDKDPLEENDVVGGKPSLLYLTYLRRLFELQRIVASGLSV